MNALVMTPLVEWAYSYLNFVGETAVAALVIHGIEISVVMYFIKFIDTYSDYIVSMLANFGFDLSALVAELKNMLIILAVFLGSLAAQDVMYWVLSKLGDDVSEIPVVQFVAYGITIIDALALLTA